MELARNPSMLQELMRTHDRALSNLESIPGGHNALTRMYRDIQEPMFNAAAERNPFAALVDNNTSNTDAQNPQQGQENRDPLPNPWSPGGTDSSTTGTTTGTAGTGTTTTTGAGIGRGLINTPGMQSLMNQIMNNPTLMRNLLESPYTRSALETMSSDPEMVSRIISSNPLLRNNPQMQQQMTAMMPRFIEQMQNPQMQNLITNPDAMSALMQIQQGMEQLRNIAPDVVGK